MSESNNLFLTKLALAAMLMCSSSAWSAQNPIGSLSVEGRATITAQGGSFILENEGYAYFSNDGIRMDKGSRAVLRGSDKIKVVFGESSIGEVSVADGVYSVNVIEGQIAVESDPGVEYQLFSNGEAVALNSDSAARGGIVLSANPESGDVLSYSPAELSQEQIDSLRASGAFSEADLDCLIDSTKDTPQDVLKSMSVEQLAELINCDKAGAALSGGQIALLAAVLVGGAVILTDDDDSKSGS